MFSLFFIKRPIFSIVLALLIVIAGLVSLFALPVSQYPTITPVQIQVTTTYPGADSKTVSESVAAPIETEINGVENMLYMTSTSSNTGRMTLTVYFSLDVDPDIAQVLVQNRVNLALSKLPDPVKKFGISVQKQSTSTLMIIAILDKKERYTPDFVTTYTNVYILDAIKRVEGAGEAQIFGVPDQAMRIWMNPDRMTSLGITTTDLFTAVSNQNALLGAGQIGGMPSEKNQKLSFPVVTSKPFDQPKEYENIILKASQDASAIVRVGDVARAEVGKKQYIDNNQFNSAPATPIVVYQQAGANGLKVSKEVRKTLTELKKSMPEGMEAIIALDTTDFVKLSIVEVIKTLIEAFILVVLVVYLFLQSFKATLICMVATIVSLIGTFIGMLALGFSINLLTLFGLILAIGIVVDDAIVVVERVESNIKELKLDPKEAAKIAMQEVFGPVIAVVLVMCAVFIPAAFLPGTTGQLYQQFAITIAISVALSGFVALTLTPSMAASLLKHEKESSLSFFKWFNRSFTSLTAYYGKWALAFIRKSAFSLLIFGMMVICIFYLFRVVPTSFVPNEDQGYVLAELMMPDATSLPRTSEAASLIDQLFKEHPAVENRTVINGYSLIDSQYKTNSATFFVTLKDFKKREESASQLLSKVAREANKINSGRFVPIEPPAIPGIGTTGGFEGWIQDLGAGEPDKLFEWTKRFVEKAKGRKELQGVASSFRANSLQLKVDVDRSKAELLGVSIRDIYSALQAQLGSIQVSQYEQYSRTWDVILQSDAPFRKTPHDITRLYTRSKNQEMIPLSALVAVDYTKGPDLVPHFNGFPAAQVTGDAKEGYSSGNAILAMEEVAKEVLPSDYRLTWSGMAYQEKESKGSSGMAFLFGVVIVFLILAAQYESWSLPASVLMAVPFGIIGALIATFLRGLENDVYFQIGLLVLVGLAAKNAVLIVEFAVELEKQGKSSIDSAIIAGKIRFRPIIMTSLAFILGVVPLYTATGAGANARHSIGTGILGGMIGASTLALLFVPLFFTLLRRLTKK